MFDITYQPNEKYLEIYERVRPALLELQSAAKAYNIPDIFQDNGGKTFEICARLGLNPLKGRAGNDAVDTHGNEYEIKTANLNGQVTSYSIHHTVTENVLNKYRSVYWIFAEYQSIELQQVFAVSPYRMKEYIDFWQKRMEDYQRRTVPQKFKAGMKINVVRQIGTLVYSNHITLFNDDDSQTGEFKLENEKCNQYAGL